MNIKTIVRIKFNNERVAFLLEIGRIITGHQFISNTVDKVVMISEQLNNPIIFTQMTQFEKRDAFNVLVSPDTLQTDMLEIHFDCPFNEALVKELAKRCNKAFEDLDIVGELDIASITAEEITYKSQTFTFNCTGENQIF